MKSFIGFFRGKSIRFKLLFYFLLLILLPIVTLGIMESYIYIKSIEKETNNHTAQMIGQVKSNVEFYIKDMENITHIISREPEIIRYLGVNEYTDVEERIRLEAEAREKLKIFADIHAEISGILVVNENDYDASNEIFRVARDPLTAEPWYRTAMENPEKIQLISKPIGRNIRTIENYGADNVVSIVKALKGPYPGGYSGVVVIDMKLEIIEKTIKDIKLGKNGFIYIIDSKGDVVYAPVNPVVYRVKNEWLSNNDSNSIIKTIRKSRYQIMYSDSDHTNWKIIGIFSLDEALEEVKNVMNFSMIIGSLTLILAVVAALFFTSSIARPLSKLRKLMKKAEGGDLTVHFESKYNDEIGQLGNSFNHMIREINKLIKMVYLEQKSKREAELQTLQAQIKPHFLYNTLDTIQWMAHEHNAQDIVEIVGALTSLFRIGLSKGQEMVSVAEELEHVRSYMIIQKTRYEEKLEYEIVYDEEILDCRMLKLILQPLAENAVYHGIKEKRGEGKVVISAKKSDNKLLFCIFDNGAGIDPDTMSQLNAMLKGNESEVTKLGYGIFNVNERLRLSFGNEYGISFSSTLGEGTIVEIWHPFIER